MPTSEIDSSRMGEVPGTMEAFFSALATSLAAVASVASLSGASIGLACSSPEFSGAAASGAAFLVSSLVYSLSNCSKSRASCNATNCSPVDPWNLGIVNSKQLALLSSPLSSLYLAILPP